MSVDFIDVKLAKDFSCCQTYIAICTSCAWLLEFACITSGFLIPIRFDAHILNLEVALSHFSLTSATMHALENKANWLARLNIPVVSVVSHSLSISFPGQTDSVLRFWKSISPSPCKRVHARIRSVRFVEQTIWKWTLKLQNKEIKPNLLNVNCREAYIWLFGKF